MLNKPRIDLNWLFEGLDNYCIIKISELFPYYEKNSDLDIICKDKFKFAKELLAKIGNEYNLQIRQYIAANNNLQLDILKNNSLDIKFDLTDDLSCFSKLKVNSALTQVILDGKIKKTDSKIFTPNEVHEAVVRYLEYKEYSHVPKKIKHLHYFNKNEVVKMEALKVIDKFCQQ